MPTRKANRGKIQFESPHYRVYEKQQHILFVAKGSDIPNILLRDAKTKMDADKYVPYKYRREFKEGDNDCLRFAEALAKGVVRHTEQTCVFNVQGSTRKFGVTDKKNIELARKHHADEKAAPTVGQAFAIVRTDLRKVLKEDADDVAPYHIAYVILEDGDDWRVTIEADAGNPDLAKPVFGIYSVADDAKSFHAVYDDMYGESAAATIVLEKNERQES